MILPRRFGKPIGHSTTKLKERKKKRKFVGGWNVGKRDSKRRTELKLKKMKLNDYSSDKLIEHRESEFRKTIMNLRAVLGPIIAQALGQAAGGARGPIQHKAELEAKLAEIRAKAMADQQARIEFTIQQREELKKKREEKESRKRKAEEDKKAQDLQLAQEAQQKVLERQQRKEAREAKAKAQAEADAKAQAEADAKAQAEADAKAQAEAQAQIDAINAAHKKRIEDERKLKEEIEKKQKEDELEKKRLAKEEADRQNEAARVAAEIVKEQLKKDREEAEAKRQKTLAEAKKKEEDEKVEKQRKLAKKLGQQALLTKKLEDEQKAKEAKDEAKRQEALRQKAQKLFEEAQAKEAQLKAETEAEALRLQEEKKAADEALAETQRLQQIREEKRQKAIAVEKKRQEQLKKEQDELERLRVEREQYLAAEKKRKEIERIQAERTKASEKARIERQLKDEAEAKAKLDALNAEHKKRIQEARQQAQSPVERQESIASKKAHLEAFFSKKSEQQEVKAKAEATVERQESIASAKAHLATFLSKKVEKQSLTQTPASSAFRHEEKKSSGTYSLESPKERRSTSKYSLDSPDEVMYTKRVSRRSKREEPSTRSKSVESSRKTPRRTFTLPEKETPYSRAHDDSSLDIEKDFKSLEEAKQTLKKQSRVTFGQNIIKEITPKKNLKLEELTEFEKLYRTPQLKVYHRDYTATPSTVSDSPYAVTTPLTKLGRMKDRKPPPHTGLKVKYSDKYRQPFDDVAFENMVDRFRTLVNEKKIDYLLPSRQQRIEDILKFLNKRYKAGMVLGLPLLQKNDYAEILRLPTSVWTFKPFYDAVKDEQLGFERDDALRKKFIKEKYLKEKIVKVADKINSALMQKQLTIKNADTSVIFFIYNVMMKDHPYFIDEVRYDNIRNLLKDKIQKDPNYKFRYRDEKNEGGLLGLFGLNKKDENEPPPVIRNQYNISPAGQGLLDYLTTLYNEYHFKRVPLNNNVARLIAEMNQNYMIEHYPRVYMDMLNYYENFDYKAPLPRFGSWHRINPNNHEDFDYTSVVEYMKNFSERMKHMEEKYPEAFKDYIDEKDVPIAETLWKDKYNAEGELLPEGSHKYNLFSNEFLNYLRKPIEGKEAGYNKRKEKLSLLDKVQDISDPLFRGADSNLRFFYKSNYLHKKNDQQYTDDELKDILSKPFKQPKFFDQEEYENTFTPRKIVTPQQKFTSPKGTLPERIIAQLTPQEATFLMSASFSAKLTGEAQGSASSDYDSEEIPFVKKLDSLFKQETRVEKYRLKHEFLEQLQELYKQERQSRYEKGLEVSEKMKESFDRSNVFKSFNKQGFSFTFLEYLEEEDTIDKVFEDPQGLKKDIEVILKLRSKNTTKEKKEELFKLIDDIHSKYAEDTGVAVQMSSQYTFENFLFNHPEYQSKLDSFETVETIEEELEEELEEKEEGLLGDIKTELQHY